MTVCYCQQWEIIGQKIAFFQNRFIATGKICNVEFYGCFKLEGCSITTYFWCQVYLSLDFWGPKKWHDSIWYKEVCGIVSFG